MRKYDIPYVQNGSMNMFPSPKLEEMTLDEIIKKYLRTCAKSNGQVSVCSKCLAPCTEGKRAIQLLANKVYNDPPIPLYGGKTLIEKAREENMKRREAKTEKEPEKKKYMKREGWYEDSLASGDQVKWLMTEMGISRTQAKKKIYQYRYTHGMTGSEAKPVEKEESSEEVQEIKNLVDNSSIETKLETLMKKQEEHKKAMEKYLELYNKEKEMYEQIKLKTDTLCSAMDILNE